VGGGRCARLCGGAARPYGVGAAQEAAHASQQQARLDRLTEVVVGADFQAHHLVDPARACGEEDDRTRERAAELTAELQAVLVRQHLIEDDQIGTAGLEPLFDLRAVGDDAHLQAIFA
jgi:hypothetical protein